MSTRCDPWFEARRFWLDFLFIFTLMIETCSSVSKPLHALAHLILRSHTLSSVLLCCYLKGLFDLAVHKISSVSQLRVGCPSIAMTYPPKTGKEPLTKIAEEFRSLAMGLPHIPFAWTGRTTPFTPSPAGVNRKSATSTSISRLTHFSRISSGEGFIFVSIYGRSAVSNV